MSPQHDDTCDPYDSAVLSKASTEDVIVGPSLAQQQQEFEHRQRRMMDELERSQRQWDQGQYYDWKLHFPRKFQRNPIKVLKWLRSGFVLGPNEDYESDERRKQNLYKMASLLKLLRTYYELYGLPKDGGPSDQLFVLREVLKDLYAGGGPVWVLEKAMERGAEGITGRADGVDVGILPRKASICISNIMISMFRIQSGFNIQRLTSAEKILVRMASFASNTSGFSNIPSKFPSALELQRAAATADIASPSSLLSSFMDRSVSSKSLRTSVVPPHIDVTSSTADDDAHRDLMAKQILNLASSSEGLFFFINSSDRPDTSTQAHHHRHPTVKNGKFTSSSHSKKYDEDDSFWHIEEHISDLFSRLATIEAIQMLVEAHTKKSVVLYPKYIQLFFSFMASAGACAFWFHGSWIDIAAAGFCGFLVRIISGWSFLAKEDRIVFEAIASVLVGLIAGLLSCLYPNKTCFVAIGLSGVLDILQGFKVVYSIIEVMGKHTVSGGADFLEGLLYTTLISFFLRVGKLMAESITGQESSLSACEGGINEAYYFILVPAAAISWSGLFNPEYFDLPLMAFHGILAFLITWACNRGNVNAQVALFLAAFGVTFSSGLVSRFTGRQAMGNTIAGLFVLVPGAYLVNALFSDLTFNFIGPVIVNAAIIGTGAWSGTIVCSPTIVGTTAARLRKGAVVSRVFSRHDQHDNHSGNHYTGPMLFF
jgi:uncharacterized membrane protein YjjP (DUF1212 family)